MTARLLILLCAASLAGCEGVTVTRYAGDATEAEVEYARQKVALLSDGRILALSEHMLPDLRDQSLGETLAALAALVPAERVLAEEVLLATAIESDDQRLATVLLQHRYAGSWLVFRVTLASQPEPMFVAGLYVEVLPESLQELVAFSIHRRGLAGYLFLLLAMVIPVFMLTVFIICLRTPIPRRKWAWALFTLVGVSPVSMNWATGEVAYQLIGLNLLGSGLFRHGELAPWVITIAAPVGAVVFLMRRREWIAGAPVNQAGGQ